jgi:cysteine-rich repeat protein
MRAALSLSLVLVGGVVGCFVDQGPDVGDSSSSTGDGTTGDPTTGGPSMCGDGVREGGEICDDGALNTPYGACGPLCLPNFCGDGYPGPDDTCDDGNDDETDQCLSDCELPACGDGVLQFGETCDDGNLNEDDLCTSLCRLPECGDGVVSTPETCDLGSGNADGGHCSGDCSAAVCGDGVVQIGEACEAPAEFCVPETCRWSTCGNAMLEPHETCDGASETCTSFCTTPRCGDGELAAAELCDDGNAATGDDCTPGCEPSICGDGELAVDEACDDPKLTLGGCNKGCERGAYFVFVTSETFQGGELGGLQGADDQCGLLAAKALLPGTYRAWLSDSSSSPATRFSKSTLPYILPPGPDGVGVTVAQSWADLVDGDLEHAINVTENGDALAPGQSCSAAEVLAWTRTDPTAGPLSESADCGAWKFNAGSVGATGLINSASTAWTAGCAEVSCAKSLHLYCVEQPS